MAKDKAPAFQLYAADFFVDTAGWTAAQVGAYFRLLLTEWVNGPLSSKITDLARIAGVDHRNMQKMWLMVIAKKFTVNDAGMYINLRLEETRKEQEEWREKQRESGLRGAKERWKDKQNNDGNPIGNPNGENMALQSSSSVFKEIKEIKAERQPSLLPTIEEKKELSSLCVQVNSKCGMKFNSFAWIQKNIGLNPQTHIHVLRRLLETKDIRNPWGLADQIASIEDGNYNEKDHISESEKHKIEPGQVGNIFKNIMSKNMAAGPKTREVENE